jgi:hypothetical protein
MNTDNTTRYKQLKVSVVPEIAMNFKNACSASNISMAAKLTELMADFSGSKIARKPLYAYTTKRKRRAALRVIVEQLEQIRDSEQQYQERIPENLQGSVVYEKADEFISTLDEAIELLTQL